MTDPQDMEPENECPLCQSVTTIGTHRHTKSCKRRRKHK